MFRIINIILVSVMLALPIKAEDKNLDDKEHQWSFFSGTFDFSDDGARATLFGIQHQNESLLEKVS